MRVRVRGVTVAHIARPIRRSKEGVSGTRGRKERTRVRVHIIIFTLKVLPSSILIKKGWYI